MPQRIHRTPPQWALVLPRINSAVAVGAARFPESNTRHGRASASAPAASASSTARRAKRRGSMWPSRTGQIRTCSAGRGPVGLCVEGNSVRHLDVAASHAVSHSKNNTSRWAFSCWLFSAWTRHERGQLICDTQSPIDNSIPVFWI